MNLISFGSLKSNMKISEQNMKDFRIDYPFMFHSSSYIWTKINNPKIEDRIDAKISEDPGFFDKIKNLLLKYGDEILAVRKEIDIEYKDRNAFIKNVSKAVKKNKAANCSEQAILMHDKFIRNGIDTHIIQMDIYSSDKNKLDNQNHSFVLIGTDKNAQINNPKSWGNEAVITDPWSNVVLPAKDGLNYFKKIFNFNPETDTILYTDVCAKFQELA